MLNNTKGVLFDFNGTLFFDSYIHEQAWKMICEKYGQKILNEKEYYQHINGRTNEAILEYIFHHSISAEDAIKIGAEKEELYRDLCRRGTPRLVSGAVQLLEYLMEQDIPFTIATSSEITNVKFYFEVFSLDKWFDFNKVIYNDGSFPGKPEPEIYLKAAEMIKLPAKQCIVVEDALAGIQAARRANIGTIIAIAPIDQHLSFQSMREVDDVIANFHEFDRMLLR